MPPWQQEARIDYTLGSRENNDVFANHGEQLVCAVLTCQAQPLRSYCDASTYSYCYFRMLELAKYPAVVFRLPIGRWIEEATRRPAVYIAVVLESRWPATDQPRWLLQLPGLSLYDRRLIDSALID